jgi:hypothetical protein
MLIATKINTVTDIIEEIRLDGHYLSLVQNKLCNEVGETASLEIKLNSLKIFSQFTNPLTQSIPNNRTGIMIGKVQSGKTSNFISLIGLAFDNSYDICIVFGGYTKKLLDQNTTRLRKYFKSENNVLVLMTKELIDSEKSALIERILRSRSTNTKVIIMALKKSKGHIDAIIDKIYNKSAFLRKVPALIIDDEGDQASLNTKALSQEQSATYSSILKLRSSMDIHTYVSITATPQANMLIEKVDKLSPDFGTLIYPGIGYCGLETFHSEKDSIYIRNIDETEELFLSPTGIPKSFYLALADFFVGGAIRMLRFDFEPHSMLIHPSRKIKDHRSVHTKVNVLVQQWLKKLSNPNDIAYDGLLRILEPAFEDYNKMYNTPLVFSDIEKTLQIIPYVFGEVIVMNSESIIEESEIYKKLNYNIYVGGDMLGRGITIPGLAVTYIFRESKAETNIDTLEQRARWFGYKDKPGASYIDVCRVYMTEKNRFNMNKIFLHEEDLWDTLEYAQDKEIAFKQIKRLFLVDTDELRITRTSVGPTEKYSSKWRYQTFYQKIKEYNKNNISIINTIRTNNKESETTLKIVGSSEHLLYSNLDFAYFFDQISQFRFPLDSSLQLDFIRKIYDISTKEHLSIYIDLIVMRHNILEERGIESNGQIKQLMQGRGSKDISFVKSGLKYPGDKHLLLDRQTIQVQVHDLTILGDITVKYPTLAIRLPDYLITAFNKYVTRKEKVEEYSDEE